MPELPEVETVARDLRPRIVGATIVGARCCWARTLRTHTPEDFAEAIAGRRVEAVGRRAKLVVVELSGDAALTIHLKMTGQLFVVPAKRRWIRMCGSCWSWPMGASFDSATSASSARSGCTVATRSRASSSRRSAGPRCSRDLGPEPLDPAFAVRDFRRAHPPAQGPPQAAPARSVVPRRRRQHLRRRGPVDGPAPPAALGLVAPAARRAPPVRGDPHDPGRGRRAARQLHRRLHGARRRRLDAGTAAGLPADRRAVPALRPPDQADRRSALGRRTSARGASGCRPRTAPAQGRSCARRPAATCGADGAGPSWPGRGVSARRGPKPIAPRPAPRTERDGSHETGRRAPAGPPPATAWARAR